MTLTTFFRRAVQECFAFVKSRIFARLSAAILALLFMVVSCLTLAPRAARATDDFADVATSAIPYTLPLQNATADCAAFGGHYLSANTYLSSATLVGATGATPAYCDVRGVIAPSILFDVAMPMAWNERLYGLGNGGCGDVLDSLRPQRDLALSKNFVTAATDSGIENTKGDCSWAAQRPDLVVDFAYAGIHQTALVAKQLIKLYYSRAPLASYYDSCSDGGHDGLEEAQRFPTDYDGIVAGAPFLGSWDIIAGSWIESAYASLPASQAMTQAKMDYIASVVYAKCDALDGLVDGIINDPHGCAQAFVPSRDLRVCGLNAQRTCLTTAQLTAYEKALGPVMSAGAAVFPGQALGAEIDTPGVQLPAPGSSLKSTTLYFLGNSYMQYLFPWPATDPSRFGITTFHFNTDPAAIGQFQTMFDATNLDLNQFYGRGGKLLVYHGLADAEITPYGTVAFSDALAQRYGSALSANYTFYPVPGMGHCQGGPGADGFDPMTKIVNWVEGKNPPGPMLARHLSHGSIAFTRTLCPYPSIATYRGGNPKIANSFACVRGPTGVPGFGRAP